jgi:outer membrane receptor protein involved in Fe transport
MNEFEASVDLELRDNSPGKESYRGSLVLNIPLVEDRLAARFVGFSDRDGGFIDNVFGHTPDSVVNPDFDLSLPSEWGTLDNADVVENDWNESEVYGGRLQLRWDVSDNFSATLSTMHQITDSGAYNDYDPFVGDLQTIRFHDDWRKDEFNIHSLVLEADLGFAQLVSATGYYDRTVDLFYDITVYAHYWAAQYCRDTYYTLDFATYLSDPAGQGGSIIYMDPALYGHYWTNPASNLIVFWPRYCQGQTIDSDFFNAYYSPSWQRKFTQEIRLSSEGERFDWIVGFYYEDSADDWEAPFAEPTTGGRGEVNTWDGSIAQQYYEFYWSNYYGSPVTFPGRFMSWYSAAHTDWEQQAVFGEVKWHINDAWTLTLGGRYFERTNIQYYLVNHPGALPLAPGEAPPGEPDMGDPFNRAIRLANNGLPAGREADESEFIPKISLSYSFGDDQMVYGLFTRGKRPGGINRSRGEPFFPNSYEPDTMDNIEFGYRSTFADGRGRFNLTVYNMEWSDYQLELTDPAGDLDCDEDLGLPDDSVPGVCGQPWQQIVTNAGDAHIDGIMVELDYAPTDRWTLGLNYEWMEAETDTDADLTGNGEADLVSGLRLPNVPEYKASVWGEYGWPVSLFGADRAYLRAQWSFTGETFNVLQSVEFANPRERNPEYNIGDVRFGIQGEDWDVAVFVNNVTDERAQYTIETGLFEHSFANLAEGREHIARIYTNRPREWGIRYSKRWGD